MNQPRVNVMDIFNPNAPNPFAAKQQQPQGQQQQDPAFQKTTSATDPQDPNVQKTALDSHADLFKVDDKNKQDQADPNAPFFTSDPEKMREAISKMNFMETPEQQQLAQQALKGDPQALMNLLNNTMQGAFGKMVQFNSAMSEQTARASMDRALSQLPAHVREMQTTEALQNVNPVFTHPAMKPMVDMIRQQYVKKNPNATAAEIAKMVNGYFQDASKQLGAPSNEDPTAHRRVDAQGQNFAEFFGFGQQ